MNLNALHLSVTTQHKTTTETSHIYRLQCKEPHSLKSNVKPKFSGGVGDNSAVSPKHDKCQLRTCTTHPLFLSKTQLPQMRDNINVKS